MICKEIYIILTRKYRIGKFEEKQNVEVNYLFMSGYLFFRVEQFLGWQCLRQGMLSFGFKLNKPFKRAELEIYISITADGQRIRIESELFIIVRQIDRKLI